MVDSLRLRFPMLCASAAVGVSVACGAGHEMQPGGDTGDAGDTGDHGEADGSADVGNATQPPAFGESDTGAGSGARPDSGAPSDASTAGSDVSSSPAVDANTPRNDAGTAGRADGAPGGAGGGADAGGSAWTCPTGPFGSPIPSEATPTRIAGVPPSDTFNGMNANFGVIEGPVWIGDALYVSEILDTPNPPSSRILKVTAQGVVTVAIADSGSNGLAVDKDGELFGAVHKDGSISRFDLSTGARTPIITTYNGKRFDSPNDLAIRSDGTVYFSDPDYQAAMPPAQPSTGLYRGVPGSTVGALIDGTLDEPNGVTLSLDEKTMYVASVGGVYAYPLMADGSVGAGTVFAPGVNGDGMVIDCAGNLYVVEADAVIVLSPTGAQIGQVSVPAASVQSLSNVAFGGSDHKTLYITALGTGGQKGLFQVALSVPGMPY